MSYLMYETICMNTVNSEIFARILFPRKALKDIVVMFKIDKRLIVTIV